MLLRHHTLRRQCVPLARRAAPCTLSGRGMAGFKAPAADSGRFQSPGPRRVRLGNETVEDTLGFLRRGDSPAGNGGDPRFEPAVLISAVPPREIEGRTTRCDGGGGALGHPAVFINLDKPGATTCGYCGLRFVQRGESHH